MDGGTFNNVSRKAPFQNFENDKNVKSDSPSLRHTSDSGRKIHAAALIYLDSALDPPRVGRWKLEGSHRASPFHW